MKMREIRDKILPRQSFYILVGEKKATGWQEVYQNSPDKPGVNKAILAYYDETIKWLDSPYDNTRLHDPLYHQKELLLTIEGKGTHEIPFPHLVYCLHKHAKALHNSTYIPETIRQLIQEHQTAYEDYIQSDTLKNLILKNNLHDLNTTEKAQFLLDKYNKAKEYDSLNDLIYHYAPILQEDNALQKELIHTFSAESHEKELLSYLYFTYHIDQTPETAREATRYYVSNRYYTEFDATAVDYNDIENRHGHWYPFEDLPNPIGKFDPQLLTLQEWHDIACMNTNILKHLPEEVRNAPEFWTPSTDFIGRGSYKNQSTHQFDEREVFRYLPESLKQDEATLCQLLSQRGITLDFIPEPTLTMYQAVHPADYPRIPKPIREQLYDKAIEAFRYQHGVLGYIPKKLIDPPMIEKLLKANYYYMLDFPKQVTQEIIDYWLGENSPLNREKAARTTPLDHHIHNSKHYILNFFPRELRTNENCLNALKYGIYSFPYTPYSLQEEVVKNIRLPEKISGIYQTPSLTKEEVIRLLEGKEVTKRAESLQGNTSRIITFGLNTLDEFWLEGRHRQQNRLTP